MRLHGAWRLMRPKTCPSCREKFTPIRPLQVVCLNHQCLLDHVKSIKAKRERKETKERKAKLKTRRDWLREAQTAFNRFIRMRDAGQPCISCGRHHEGQYHAGHYLSVGAKPELRFNELNVHLQCQPCNTHLSGNLVNYRTRLLTKIGAEQVQFLEGPHEPKKYTVEELKQIKADYTALAKELA